jgi:hypothetical protein
VAWRPRERRPGRVVSSYLWTGKWIADADSAQELTVVQVLGPEQITSQFRCGVHHHSTPVLDTSKIGARYPLD